MALESPVQSKLRIILEFQKMLSRKVPHAFKFEADHVLPQFAKEDDNKSPVAY
jgi:hypothetical protein